MDTTLATLLSDRSLPRARRLTLLQGWTGDDADRAETAAGAQRIAPAVCAAGATLGVITGSWPLLAFFAATAAVGRVAANHPFETLYNHLAARSGRPQLPANRAAKRMGCAMGAVFLGGAAVAFAAGATTWGVVLAGLLAAVAAFVAATGICVPSIMFRLQFGHHRAEAACFSEALRRPRSAPEAEPVVVTGELGGTSRSDAPPRRTDDHQARVHVLTTS
jgi:hypothetical protein